jgi:Rho termination factor, RNA-binding domain/Clp amino terminal domain, pathogenicity island component
MQLTPRAKRMIDLAYEEARSLSNNYIGTEHLLLGLIREEDDWSQGEQAGATPGQGVLEILADGWGFLRRRADLTPSSDDIYVSQSQIQRFALKSGDWVSGKVRPPQEDAQYYGLLRVEAKNEEDLASAYFDDRGGGVLIQLGATLDRARREVQAMQEQELTLMQRVQAEFVRAVERGTVLSPEMRALINVLTVQDVGRLADAIMPHLALGADDQQALKETKTHTDRLEKLSELLKTAAVQLDGPNEQET